MVSTVDLPPPTHYQGRRVVSPDSALPHESFIDISILNQGQSEESQQATMSISRAFTTRRVKQSIQAAEQQESAPHRSNSIRNKISSPIELIHTTNMLSYNAPDIHPLSASSTGSSQRSDDDMSDSALTAGTTPPTSPDVESTPAKRSLSPEPNHLSSFFTAPGQPIRAPTAQSGTPVVPQRALSQPKKYNTLVRQRSESGMSQKSHRTVSTKASFSFSRSSSTSTSTSVSSAPTYHKSKLSTTAAAAAAAPAAASPTPAPHSPAAAPRPPRPQPPTQLQPQPQQKQQQHQQFQHQQQHRRDLSEAQQQQQQQQQHQQPQQPQPQPHPFGPELAQVSEIAEEYGVREHLASAAVEREEQEMLARGLLKFSADEYLSEVRGLFAGFMIPAPRPVAAAWI